MRRPQLIFGILLVLWSCNVKDSSNEESDEGQNTNEYKLVWSDEFDGSGKPDETKWNYDLGGHGWGNNELEYYTDREENARVENGLLIIEALKESFDSSEYTSARIKTMNKGDWKYGRIEVNAKLPSGKGTWPAIWMLPTMEGRRRWPADGEIDIMEHVGFDQGRIHGTIHTQAYNHVLGTQKSGQKMVEDASDAFHTYTINWNADSIEWFIDNEKYFAFLNENKGKEEWPFDNPFHLILNIAVGGNWGGQQGIDDSIWPQRMEVDWVRIYQKR